MRANFLQNVQKSNNNGVSNFYFSGKKLFIIYDSRIDVIENY